MKSGTIFDNFLMTTDEAFAEKFADDTWGALKEGEKKTKDEQDEEERKKNEEKAKEEEAAAGGSHRRKLQIWPQRPCSSLPPSPCIARGEVAYVG